MWPFRKKETERSPYLLFLEVKENEFKTGIANEELAIESTRLMIPALENLKVDKKLIEDMKKEAEDAKRNILEAKLRLEATNNLRIRYTKRQGNNVFL